MGRSSNPEPGHPAGARVTNSLHQFNDHVKYFIVDVNSGRWRRIAGPLYQADKRHQEVKLVRLEVAEKLLSFPVTERNGNSNRFTACFEATGGTIYGFALVRREQ